MYNENITLKVFSTLKARLNLATLVLLAISSITMIFFVNYFQKQSALRTADEKSIILLKHNLAIHSYINKRLKPALFSLTDSIREPDYFDSTWMSSTYAVREIDKLYQQSTDTVYYYKEAAINARSPENEADEFERDFIQRLNSDRNLNKLSGIRDFENKPYFFTLLRGESLEKMCMRCHSTPDKAPGKLVKTYGTKRSFNRSEEETVSAISIRIPLEQAYRDANAVSVKLSGIISIFFLVLLFVKNILIHHQVIVPLNRLRLQAESISGSSEHLGEEIPQIYAREINEIAASFNSMSYRLKQHVDELETAVRNRTSSLEESENRFRQLFENMINGFALHEMIYDSNGNPCDYRFIEVNPAFENLTGLAAADIEGKTVLEVMPKTEQIWMETYGKIAAGGQPLSFEKHSCELNRYYQVWAFCPKPGFFATVFSDITERRNIQNELRNLFLEQRTILDASTVGITMVKNRVVVWANRAMCEIFGYFPEEIRNVGTDFFYPSEEEYRRLGDEAYPQLAKGHEFRTELKMRRNGGSLIWILLQGRAINPLNPEEGSVWIFEDIGDRKQWEQTVQHRLEFLTSPIDTTSSIAFSDLFNLDEIQKIQDAFALATGVASMITDTRGNPITKPSNFTDLCLNIIRNTPQGLANCLRSDAVLGKGNPDGPTIKACMSGGLLDGGTGIHVGGHHVANWLVGQVLDESIDPETMIPYAREIGADEEAYRQALSRVSRMSREQFEKVCQALNLIAGQLSRMAMQNVHQAQYITELKQAKDALNASENRFRETLENVHLIAVTLDTYGRLTFCNEFLCTLSGWSRDEILGADWFEMFIEPELRDSLRAVFTKGVLSGDLPLHYENSVVTRDGKLRSVVWDNTILHNPDNSIAGVASIGIDVTDHQHLEEQLLQSQKMEAIGQLAGGVAHDFNNILTVIMGYSSILQMEGNLNEAQQEQIEEIVSSSERAAKLTAGLLAFSRKQKMDKQDTNLNHVVQKVQVLLARILGEDIQFTFTMNEPDLPVTVDSGQIEQVLINLATNARDAMPYGGTLRLETGVQESDGSIDPAKLYGEPVRYAWIAVSDTGSGMDQETRARIFEPFFTTKEVGKGTGLGMAIVYGIVKQHNGFITVLSEPCQGTSFRVYLPIREDVSMSAEDDRPLTDLPPGGTETILLAEDDPSVRNLVVTVLTNFGYKVIQAEDGQQAIELFTANRHTISMLLMDMIMPRKNGKEAYEEISRLQPGVKVLYSSGYTADFIQERGVSEEGIDLIMKPVHPVDLLRKVREILDT